MPLLKFLDARYAWSRCASPDIDVSGRGLAKATDTETNEHPL